MSVMGGSLRATAAMVLLMVLQKVATEGDKNGGGGEGCEGRVRVVMVGIG